MEVTLIFPDGQRQELPIDTTGRPLILPRLNDVLRINGDEWFVCKILWDVDQKIIFVMVI